jgi:hypothetical protein
VLAGDSAAADGLARLRREVRKALGSARRAESSQSELQQRLAEAQHALAGAAAGAAAADAEAAALRQRVLEVQALLVEAADGRERALAQAEDCRLALKHAEGELRAAEASAAAAYAVRDDALAATRAASQLRSTTPAALLAAPDAPVVSAPAPAASAAFMWDGSLGGTGLSSGSSAAAAISQRLELLELEEAELQEDYAAFHARVRQQQAALRDGLAVSGARWHLPGALPHAAPRCSRFAAPDPLPALPAATAMLPPTARMALDASGTILVQPTDDSVAPSVCEVPLPAEQLSPQGSDDEHAHLAHERTTTEQPVARLKELQGSSDAGPGTGIAAAWPGDSTSPRAALDVDGGSDITSCDHTSPAPVAEQADDAPAEQARGACCMPGDALQAAVEDSTCVVVETVDVQPAQVEAADAAVKPTLHTAPDGCGGQPYEPQELSLHAHRPQELSVQYESAQHQSAPLAEHQASAEFAATQQCTSDVKGSIGHESYSTDSVESTAVPSESAGQGAQSLEGLVLAPASASEHAHASPAVSEHAHVSPAVPSISAGAAPSVQEGGSVLPHGQPSCACDSTHIAFACEDLEAADAHTSAASDMRAAVSGDAQAADLSPTLDVETAEPLRVQALGANEHAANNLNPDPRASVCSSSSLVCAGTMMPMPAPVWTWSINTGCMCKIPCTRCLR